MKLKLLKRKAELLCIGDIVIKPPLLITLQTRCVDNTETEVMWEVLEKTYGKTQRYNKRKGFTKGREYFIVDGFQ